jgi:phospholipid/cholesterol/gamma-HCH transport system permease protein
MVREVAGLMTGIILAGRVGAAFAAQLATMQAGEEIDALRVLGVDPIDHLVLPRLLAMVLVAPLDHGLSARWWGAGRAGAWLVYGVAASEYLQRSLEALTWTHLWIGASSRAPCMPLLVALAGCREGLHAGRSAQAVGLATTAAVVKGLVWIVCRRLPQHRRAAEPGLLMAAADPGAGPGPAGAHGAQPVLQRALIFRRQRARCWP